MVFKGAQTPQILAVKILHNKSYLSDDIFMDKIEVKLVQSFVLAMSHKASFQNIDTHRATF